MLKYFLFSFFSLLTFSLHAQESCSYLFAKDYIQDLSHLSINWTEATSQSTVVVTDRLADSKGGQLLRLQKNEQSWLSNYSEFLFDIQGDPRWFIGALGEHFATFFGFKMKGPQELWIPDGVAFESALQQLNSQLQKENRESIPLSISTTDLSTQPLKGYLHHFLRDQLHFSSEDHHLIHDISFHTGFIFLPPRLVRLAQIRTEFMLEFANSLAQDSSFLNAAESKLFLSTVKEFLVEAIDQGVGFQNLSMIANDNSNEEIQTQISDLISQHANSSIPATHSAIMASSYLAFGLFIEDFEFYKNIHIRASLPAKAASSFYSLDEHTVLIFSQLLSEIFEVHRSEEDIQLLLQQKMESFLKTPSGINGTLNLIELFVPANLKNTDTGNPFYGRDLATAFLQELLQRRQEIQNAIHHLQDGY